MNISSNVSIGMSLEDSRRNGKLGSYDFELKEKVVNKKVAGYAEHFEEFSTEDVDSVEQTLICRRLISL
ncbi:hypothetical protein SLE2022_292940 [Rubroshorea leprosula]